MDDDAFRRMAETHVVEVHYIGQRLRDVAVRIAVKDPDLGEALNLIGLGLMRNADLLHGSTATKKPRSLLRRLIDRLDQLEQRRP